MRILFAHELQVRLRAGRRILELQTKLIAAREELRQQATHDPPLLRAADRALYRAKQEGRNCVVLNNVEEKEQSAPEPGSLRS